MARQPLAESLFLVRHLLSQTVSTWPGGTQAPRSALRAGIRRHISIASRADARKCEISHQDWNYPDPACSQWVLNDEGGSRPDVVVRAGVPPASAIQLSKVRLSGLVARRAAHGSFNLVRPVDNPLGNPFQRYSLANTADTNRLFGHSENHAAFFVLGHRV